MRFKENEEITGAGLLETITGGLYNDNSNCIREYVQNAIDSLNGITDPERLKIEISFINNGNTIQIRDYGQGMDYNELYDALKLGFSLKSGENIGWRGIGIYSGVPNFNKIVITTKKDNNIKFTVKIDCIRFYKDALARNKSAKEVIEEAVSDIEETEDPDFKSGTLISLEGIREGQETNFSEDAIKYKLIRTIPLKVHDSLFKEKIVHFLNSAGIQEPPFIVIINKQNGGQEEIRRPIINDTIFDPESFCSYIHKDPSNNQKTIFAIWVVTAKNNFEIEGGKINGPSIPSYRKVHHGIIFKKKLMTIGKADEPEITVRNLHLGSFNFWNYGEIHILSNDIKENAGRDNFENLSDDYRKMVEEVRKILKELMQINRKKSSNDKTKEIENIEKLIDKKKYSDAKKKIKKVRKSLEKQVVGSSHPLLKGYSEILERRRQSQLDRLNELERSIPESVLNVEVLDKMANNIIEDKNIKKLKNKIKNPDKKTVKSVLDGIEKDLRDKTGIQGGEFVDLVKESFGLGDHYEINAKTIWEQSKLFIIKPALLIKDSKKKDEMANKYAYMINGNIAQMLIAMYQFFVNSDKHHRKTFSDELYKKIGDEERKIFIYEAMFTLDFLKRLIKYSVKREELASEDLPEPR